MKTISRRTNSQKQPFFELKRTLFRIDGFIELWRFWAAAYCQSRAWRVRTVVATNSGGPNDIVERCNNGELVCPRDPLAIATSCREIVTDRHKWVRYATAGGEAVAAYYWDAHRSLYLVETDLRARFRRAIDFYRYGYECEPDLPLPICARCHLHLQLHESANERRIGFIVEQMQTGRALSGFGKSY